MTEQIRRFLYGVGSSINIFGVHDQYVDSKGFYEDQCALRSDVANVISDFNEVSLNYGKTHQG